MLRPLREAIENFFRRTPPPAGWEEAQMRERIRADNRQKLLHPSRRFLSAIDERDRHRNPRDIFFRPEGES